MEKIGFVSLGCSKNLIDTEVMLGILRDLEALDTYRCEADANIAGW